MQIWWPQRNDRCGEQSGGQLNYVLGHPGVAVAFKSGFGDGTYEVFAEIMEHEGLGSRVKKVWVELITDEEIKEIEQTKY